LWQASLLRPMAEKIQGLALGQPKNTRSNLKAVSSRFDLVFFGCPLNSSDLVFPQMHYNITR
ncbi:MAG: hypothetical protein Q7S52_02345, partial [bacterium]|nr:hypothetical protein [bacterium]